LSEARREAARDIVDANLEEKEAALALQEAILGIAEAKRRLREEEQQDQLLAQNIADTQAQIREARDRLAQARSEGDTEEISLALAQLNVAEQNLARFQEDAREAENNIKQAQIDVKQAEVNRQQALIRSKRAEEDAAEARRKGVEGSDKVQQAQKNLASATESIARAERQQVLANRALRDAINGLAEAKRNQLRAEEDLTDAQKKQTEQQEQLQQQLADLSPAERRLFQSIRRLQERYRELFRPITDIIVDSFARAVDRVLILLQDPKILGATRKLASSIAGAIDVISRFTVTPEFRNFLVFTINNAARNVPKITDAFVSLFRVLMRIAQTATPLFNNLIDRFARFADRLEKSTRDTSGLERFFSIAGRHLDSWIKFGAAVVRILGLIVKLSAPTGETLLDRLTNQLNEWSDWLNSNESRVLEFFEGVEKSVSALAQTLGIAIGVLFEAFTSENQTALTQFILETLLPAFTLFLQILGQLARAFNALTSIPILGEFIKFAATIIIVEKLFNRLIPATQKLTNAFLALMRVAFSGQALASIRNWVQLMRTAIILARQGALANTLAAGGFIKMAVAVRALSAAFGVLRAASIAALFTPPLGIITLVAAVVAGLVILELKFGLISKAVERMTDVFRKVANFFTTNWKTVVLAAILAPFSPFLAGGVFLVRFRKGIIDAAQGVIDFFKRNWKQLALLIVSPFGFAVYRLIKKFGDDVTRTFSNVANSVTSFFRDLPSNIGRYIRQIDDAFFGLVRAAEEFGRDLVQGIIDGVKSKAGDLKNVLIDVIKGAWGFVKDALGIDSPSRYTRDQIGVPMGEGIVEGTKEGLSGMGSEISLALRNELSGLEREADNIKSRIASSLGGLQGLVSEQIGSRLGDLTPAERELQALDRSETERGRKQEIKDAATTVRQSNAEVTKAQKELARAQKALNNADTAEKKQKARDDLRNAKLALSDAQKQLEDALKQQAETERRVALDRRRQSLQDLAARQREELEKSVAAEQKRADSMFAALRRALNNKNWAAVQKIFSRIVDLVGIKNLGKATADNYVDGLLNQLKARQGDINKGFVNQRRQAQIAAQKEAAANRAIAGAGGKSVKGTVKSLKEQGLSDVDVIRFLVNNDLLDKGTALSIAKTLGGDAARVSFKDIIRNGGLNFGQLKFLQDLKEPKVSKPNLIKFLSEFGNKKGILKAFSDSLEELQIFEAGGTVSGGEGQPVPIIAHAGEWVLNKSQQTRLAERLGESLSRVRDFLFGPTPIKGSPGPNTTGTKPTTKESGFRGSFFELVPQQDDFGEVIWFIKGDDGSHIEIKSNVAQRIKKTNGAWLPPWLIRRGAISRNLIPDQLGRGLAKGGVVQKFLKGGVVLPRYAGPIMQSFAEGGTVLSSNSFGGGTSSMNTKNITQNFEVKASGETDWNYVLRLGAMHAKSSYT